MASARGEGGDPFSLSGRNCSCRRDARRGAAARESGKWGERGGRPGIHADVACLVARLPGTRTGSTDQGFGGSTGSGFLTKAMHQPLAETSLFWKAVQGMNSPALEPGVTRAQTEHFCSGLCCGYFVRVHLGGVHLVAERDRHGIGLLQFHRWRRGVLGEESSAQSGGSGDGEFEQEMAA